MTYDGLLHELGSETIRELDETTVARGRLGVRDAARISTDPPERLIGNSRTEVVRRAFHDVMTERGFLLQAYSAYPGSPAVWLVPGERANLIHISIRHGRPFMRKNRTLAAIASDPMPDGAFAGDLFGNVRAFQPPKPAVAWFVLWPHARDDDPEIPLWTGFMRVRALDDRRVAFEKPGIRYGDALLRARQLEAGEKPPEHGELVRLYRARKPGTK